MKVWLVELIGSRGGYHALTVAPTRAEARNVVYKCRIQFPGRMFKIHGVSLEQEPFYTE